MDLSFKRQHCGVTYRTTIHSHLIEHKTRAWWTALRVIEAGPNFKLVVLENVMSYLTWLFHSCPNHTIKQCFFYVSNKVFVISIIYGCIALHLRDKK